MDIKPVFDIVGIAEYLAHHNTFGGHYEMLIPHNKRLLMKTKYN